MDRRSFLKHATLASMAINKTGDAAREIVTQATARTEAPSSGSLILGNRELAWHFDWRDRKFGSSRFENRLSGRIFELSEVQEIRLVFSASKHRIEIPWWKFMFGPDQGPSAPGDERGLMLGYHLPETSDQNWGATENLLLRNLRGVESSLDPIAYDGYGWFRRRFSLPADSRGEDLVFVLGGYDFHDWKEYWVYLNGVEVGYRGSAGRWKSPVQIKIAPGSPAYSSIRSGPGGENLLAVRTRAYERRFGGFTDEVLHHYVYEPIIVDQFISCGAPYLSLSEFELQRATKVSPGEAIFELRDASQPLSVWAHYKLEGPTRRKWLEIRNSGAESMTLLDVQLDRFKLDAETIGGGHGAPIFAGDEVFCAIEHPAGINIAEQGRVSVMHHPGRSLAAGSATQSYVSLVSVSDTGEAVDHFVSYVREKSPRKKKVLSIYDSFGVNNQWGACPTLNDAEMLNMLKRLEGWREHGVALDYFVPDTGWIDHSSDLTEFAPQCFPDGPGEIVKTANRIGMKFGLWFPVSWGAMSNSENPAVWPDQIPTAGEETTEGPPPLVYQNGYLQEGGAPARLCIASEPYFTMFTNAILHHIRTNNLKFFKLDGINSYCNSTEHGHLPGKYSVEAAYDHLIHIASVARETEPDIALIWYWGVRSPFFALHGDSIFESGLFMEGSGSSWFPTLFYRDSVALNLDQSTRFATTVPAINKDSLGVWLADNRWGNFMGAERWREALIMDLGRGNLLFPQLWGDLSLLDDEDLAFLATMQSLVKENEPIFLAGRRTFGDPWKNQIYGWGYFRGDHGFVFANNIHFASRQTEFELGPALGLLARPGTALDVVSHFPDRTRVVSGDGSPLRAGGLPTIWLRPFEVLVLEVSPTGGLTGLPPRLPSRQVDAAAAKSLGVGLALTPELLGNSMKIELAEAGRFEKEGKKKRSASFTSQLPSLEGDQPILAIAVRLRKNGQEWRYSPVVAEIVQVVARIGPEHLALIPVPESRQFGNTQKAGCSWVVYKARIRQEWARQKLQIAVHAYLPDQVETEVEAWVVHQWWHDSGRPAPDGFYANEPS